MNASEIWMKIENGIDWKQITTTSLRLVLILVVALILMLVIKKVLDGVKSRLLRKSQEEGEPPSESAKRIETLVRLLRQGLYLALWIMVLMLMLNQIGVKVGPLLAGAGVAGLAVGFGAQNLVRDIISGFFIILENQMRVGDVAIINGTGGLVERIRFRTTILRDLGGVVHVFPNGSINTLSNLTNEWSAYIFDIGVAYKEDTDRVIAVMEEVGKSMKEDDKFGRLMLEVPDIFGVDKFGDSAVVIKGRIKTKPIRQWEVGREYLRRIKYAFDENGIEIPFPHRTVYMGEASKPFELQMLEKAQASQAAADS
jgi:small conductance mechanosensitive channel